MNEEEAKENCKIEGEMKRRVREGRSKGRRTGGLMEEGEKKRGWE